MAFDNDAYATLANGVEKPRLGFGLYNHADGKAVERAVNAALEAGYRSFDGATLYGNEKGVGRALASSGIRRRELFVTSKAWNSEQGYRQTLDAFQRSLDRLQLDYLDLYLLHWPVPGKYLESWRALEKLHDEGLVRAIGVSNFQIHHLVDLLAHARVRPVLDQVELHPHLAQHDLHTFAKANAIQLEAWSPLAHGKILGEPVLRGIAHRHGKQPAQIVLRWLLERDILAVPKAADPAHIRQNLELFDFRLTAEDTARIDTLDSNTRIGPHPDHVDYDGDAEFIRIFGSWETAAAA